MFRGVTKGVRGHFASDSFLSYHVSSRNPEIDLRLVDKMPFPLHHLTSPASTFYSEL